MTWAGDADEPLYDVCHNIAKLEEHTVDGRAKKVWVHRKGATRAFPRAIRKCRRSTARSASR